MTHLEREGLITVRGEYPLSGVISHQGPRNPYTTSEDAKLHTSKLREISSRYGKQVESVTLDVLSGKIELEESIRSELSDNTTRLIRQLRVINNIDLHTKEKIIYEFQKLSRPPEIPFLASDRQEPDSPEVQRIFELCDMFADTTYLKDFRSLGSVVVINPYTDAPEEVIEPAFRLLVESSLTTAKLLTQDFSVALPRGKVIKNAWVVSEGVNIAQFDGIVIPQGSNTNGFDALTFFENGEPWIAIQIKTNQRIRFLARPNRINSPFTRDLAEFQNQLVRIFSETGILPLPKYLYFYYLRGINHHQIHIVRVDRQFLSNWLEVVSHNFDTGNIPEELLPDACKLMDVLCRKLDEMPQFPNTDLVNPNGVYKQSNFLDLIE